MKRTLRILSSFVCLLFLVALVLTGCNFGTKPQSTTPSDGTTAGNPPAVTTPSETTTPGNDSPIDPLGKQIPVYQGMSISTAAGVTMPSFAKEGNNGNGNTDNNGNHYGWYKGDSADDKGAVDQETPFPDANENIEQEIKDSLEVIGSKQEIYYAAQNQDVYIHIYISNPDQFEILSFTLNGQKYSSYMFEAGSTQELLILKYNVGAASGIVEYTIDQIKYIDGTEIKDVKIGGDRTVKAGIRTEDQVTATVTNLQIGTNSVSFNATIADEDNLIAYNNGVIKAVLFDGDTLVAEKELTLGSNAVTFENLKNGTVYQYAIVACYDNLTGDAIGFHVLAKKAFQTNNIVLFDNIVVGQDNINFTFKWDESVATKALTSLKLYKDGELVTALETNATTALGLLSANEYVLIAEYQDLGQPATISLTFATLQKGVPDISIINPTKTQTSVGFEIVETDVDNVGAITKIELVHANGTVVAENVDVRSFANLLSNNAYTVKVTYTYDLNDGKGEQMIVKEKEVVTLAKAVSEISIINPTKTQTSVGFEIVETDTDNVGAVTKIELVHTNGTIVAENVDVRSFANLLSNNAYTVKVTYTYNLNDGKGEQTITAKTKITTDAKVAPQVVINNIKMTLTSINANCEITDMDSTLASFVVGLYKGETLISESTDSNISFGNLDGTGCIVNVSYTYDLNDGKGVQTAVYTKNLTLTDLTITADNRTWVGYTGAEGENLVIPSIFEHNGTWYHITSIGDSSFSECRNLASITIPEGVTSIGGEAFYYCESLTTVVIPEGVTSIGSLAFCFCGQLTNVSIPSTVTNLGSGAFKGAQMTNVVIPDGITSIPDYLFEWNESLQSITIPNSVTSIGTWVFYNNTALTTITFKGTREQWNAIAKADAWNELAGNYTIYCTDGIICLTHNYENVVTEPTITENGLIEYTCSVCGDSYTETIVPTDFLVTSDKRAWVGYTGEEGENLVIPAVFEHDGTWYRVTWIYFGAFSECNNLTSVKISHGVTDIDVGAFANCTSLTSITIPSTLKATTYYSFEGCNSLESITFEGTVAQWNEVIIYYEEAKPNVPAIKVICTDGFVCLRHNYEGVVTAPTKFTDGYTTYTCSNCGDTYVGDQVPAIGSLGLAYEVNSDGTTCTITGIDTCTDTEIYIPEVIDGYTVTAIGEKAFAENSTITFIKISNTVRTIGTRAFYKCTGLTEFTIPETVTSIGSQIFNGCQNLAVVYYASPCATNQDDVFFNVAWIEKIVFTGTRIPNNICYGCTNLKEIVITDSVTFIGDNAFYGCTNLTDLPLGNNVAVIGSNAFNYAGLKTIHFPEKIHIGYGAFWYCDQIESVEFEGVVSNDWGPFRYCNEIPKISVPDLETWIALQRLSLGGYEDEPFVANALYIDGVLLENVVVPDTVNSIPNYTFYKNSNIKSVVLPDSILTIADHLFYYCTSLTSVTIPDGIPYIGDFAFYNCSALTSITIPESVTGIGDYAFSNCSALTSVTISEGVTSIGEHAFDRCSNLNTISIPNSVTVIGNYAFYMCTSLSNVKLSDSLTNIGAGTFSNCSSLINITIPDSVTSIGDNAFEGCSSLASITIPNDVMSIGGGTFLGCSSLTNVAIPNGVTSIGENAFRNCSSLTSITMPKDVTSIGNWAFYGCSNLTGITYEGTIEQWNTISFGSNWNSDVPATSVTCSDGVLCWEHTEAIRKEVPPTCTTFGTGEGIYCSVCGEWLIPPAYLPATGIHNYERTVVTEPTLTENGYATYTCSMCGDSYGEAIVLTDLTITADNRTWVGYTGAEGENLVIPSMFEHDGAWYHVTSIGDSAFSECRNLASVTIPEGVTSIGGEAFYYCESLTTVVIPEGVTSIGSLAFCFCGQLTNVSIPSTVTNLGSGAFKGAQMTNVVIPDGITSIPDYLFEWNESLQSITIPNSVTSIGTWVFYNNTALTTITFKGTREQWNAIAKADAWNELAGNYTIYCTDGIICKEHTEVVDKAVAPTCTETGLTEGKHCSVCNEVLVAQKSVNPLGHTEVVDEAVAPTCTKNGLTGGSHCSACGEIFVAQEIIPAAHTEVIDPAVEPTCTTDGCFAGSHCSVCGEILSEQFAWPSFGHTEVIDEGKAPTCTKEGLTEGKHCSVCNEVFVAQEIVEALGHTAGEAATCTTAQICTVCSVELVSALGHTEVIDKAVAPTCSATGRTEGKHCSICNEILVAQTVISALPHTEVIDEAIAPTFTEVGRTEGKHCSVCGTVIVAQELTLSGSRYGYHVFASQTNGAAMQQLYYDLYCICEQFMVSTQNVEAVDGLYIIGTIDVNDYTLTIDEAVAVWKVFYTENPKYYWLSNTITVTGTELPFCIDEAYASADYRALCDAAIEDMVDECYEVITVDLSSLEKALAIHDFILGYMEYAYESDGVTPEDDIWAHNMIGCAKYNLGVCESYAKTYLYLCLLNNVECIIVTGDAGEDHAWNMICLDDIWYAVDCTWDDTNNSEAIYDYFGMSKTYLESTHTAATPDKVGIDYWFALPELSERSLELVYLYEGDTLLGTFGNIDMAFEAMTNTDGDYTIQLGEYTLMGLWYVVEHSIYSTETPNVGSLAIVGYQTGIGEMSGSTIYMLKPVTIINDLSVNSNIIVENLQFKSTDGVSGLYINNFSITTRGEFCTFLVSIVGDNLSEILAAAIYQSEFYSTVDVHKLTQLTDHTVSLRSHAQIDLLDANLITIYHNGADNAEDIEVNIGHWYNCETISIYDKANVYIGKISNAIVDTVRIGMHFDSAEMYRTPTLGEIDCPVELFLDGENVTIITDASGNVVNTIITSASPFDIDKPTAVLKRVSDFEQLQITYHRNGNSLDATHLYQIIDNGEIVVKDYVIRNDLIIVDNRVVAYVGTDTNVVIPDGVIAIADYVFCGCSNLTSIVIPDSITSIGDYAFFGCNSLTSITIPNSVTSIGAFAFENCNALTNLIIPYNVTSIGTQAFHHCTALTNVTITNNVTNIGNYAFAGCNNLTHIDYTGTVEQWNAITLGYGWNTDSTAKEVICSDGTVTLN